MIRNFIPMLALAASLTGCSGGGTDAQAQSADAPQAIESAMTSAEFTPNWTVDYSRSHIRFTAKQKGAAFTGEFKTFTADVFYDPAQPAASLVRVSIPIADIDGRDAERNESLPSPDWFDAKSHPYAYFTARGFESEGGNMFSVNGRLEIKGVTQDVPLKFSLSPDGDALIMESKIAINRGDFKVGKGVWSTDEWVSLNVDLDIKVTAKPRNP